VWFTILALNHPQPLNGNNMKSLFLTLFLAIGHLVHAQKDTVRVSVIMPFCSKEIRLNPASARTPIGNACREYYQGFELAMDSLETKDRIFRIGVYDSKNDSNVFKRILKKQDVINSNLIIGPVVSEAQLMMSSFSKKTGIPHISPLTTMTKSKVDDPNLIAMNPDLDNYADIFLEKLKADGELQGNIVVITGKGKNDKLIASRFQALKNKYPQFSFKSLEIGRYNEFKQHFQLGKTNHVIIDSDNEYLVGSVIRMLSDSNQFNDIHVYGNKKWLNFNAIPAPVWKRLQVTIICPIYADMGNAYTRNFFVAYKERYNTEPNEFALAGYDQGLLFLQNLAENEGRLNLDALKFQRKLSGGSYSIKPKPNGKGYQNMRLNFLMFDEEYNLVPVAY